jgi:hypothetical protein
LARGSARAAERPAEADRLRKIPIQPITHLPVAVCGGTGPDVNSDVAPKQHANGSSTVSSSNRGPTH